MESIVLFVAAHYQIFFDMVQGILGCIALFGVFGALWKIASPKIKFRMLSFYHTFDVDNKMGCVMKIVVESSIDLVIDQVDVQFALLGGGDFLTTQHMRVRKKGFIPLMHDFSGNPTHYKLLKSIEPQLFDQIIKAGVDSYYIALLSVDPLPNQTIFKKWKFDIKFHYPLFFIPNFISRKITLYMDQPDGKDLYFDDEFIEKITDDDVGKIKKSL